MDSAAALERLREISSQVRSAVIFERGGKVVGSTLADQGRAKEVADEAEALLTEAEQRRDDVDEGELAQLEVAVQAGSVFIVRDGDRMIAVTTPPEPTVGLVFYDLKSCFRDLETAAASKKRAPSKRQRDTRRPTSPMQTDA